MIDKLRDIIASSGGFVNCHAHLDRAYTFNEEDFYFSKKGLKEKWKFVDKVKDSSSEEDYYNRIMKAIDKQSGFGVQAVLSFIDIDNIAGYRALNAAVKAKKDSKKVKLRIACQTLKGVVSKKQRELIESRIEDIDVIGGLPGVESPSQHMDVIFSCAKDSGKRIHVHVDQLNENEEKETEMLLEYTEKYKLEGLVSAVRSIRLAAKEKKYRDMIYDKSLDLGVSYVSCPTAWIDSERKDVLQVFHNATTPIDELIKKGICVGIGSDNINDIYKPYSDGDMMTGLRFALESNKIYETQDLINISVKMVLK